MRRIENGSASKAVLPVMIATLMMVSAVVVFAGGTGEGVVNVTEGIAIGGYDPVAYFTLGEPTLGDARHSMEWDGAVWHFSSAGHLAMFAENPERYAPSYGGYCAYAAARDDVAYGDPEVWTIHEERLFLNLSPRYEQRFRDNIESDIEKADANWPELREELSTAAGE